MKRFIPYGRHSIDQDDIDAVVKVLKSDWLTGGSKVEEFEVLVAEYYGAKYAVAFNSGTSALHAAMYAAGIEPGEEVITVPITFLASANAAVYMGAKPVFIDISPETYCMDISLIETAVSDKTRAIVPVDYAGYPVDLSKIKEIARKYNLVIIEDAAHALGAYRKGYPPKIEADMTMFSFHPVKHITTGEGGMVITNKEEYFQKLKQFRNHGMVRDVSLLAKNQGSWYYEMQDLGYNFRITDIQCALGISQFKKLESFLKKRSRVARYYDEAFKETDWITTPPQAGEDSLHAYHLYPILLAPETDRRVFFDYMRTNNIGVQVHYIPVHLQPYYRRRFGYKKGDFPVAEDFYAREVSLPIYPRLSKEEQDYVIDTIKNFYRV